MYLQAHSFPGLPPTKWNPVLSSLASQSRYPNMLPDDKLELQRLTSPDQSRTPEVPTFEDETNYTTKIFDSRHFFSTRGLVTVLEAFFTLSL
jgi:hypothetical protein